MCRLALINNNGLIYIEKKYGLEKLFDHLEYQLGGDGNGYCAVDNNGGIIELKKGIGLSNGDIVKAITQRIDEIAWVIYHTRLKSVGLITDENCHPFIYNNNVLACNGTEYELSRILRNNNSTMTDSETILRLNYKNLINGTKKYNSVCVGLFNGKVFANKNNGQLKVITHNDGSIIFASSFPNSWDEDIQTAPQCYMDGDKIASTPTETEYEYLPWDEEDYRVGWYRPLDKWAELYSRTIDAKKIRS